MAEQMDYDLIISGGGATGWSLVLALQTLMPQYQALKVALIDSFDANQKRPHPGFDARALALSRQTLDYLRQIGLSAQIAQSGTAIHRIQVTDKGAAGQVVLNHTDYQVSELGMVMEAQELGNILLKNAQSNAVESNDKTVRLDCFQPDKIIDAKTQREFLRVTTDKGHNLTTRLLVLAEGSQSSSRALLNLSVEQRDYQQHAIIANVVTEQPTHNTAFERFTASGPLAFLPMSAQRSGVVWSVAAEQIDAIMSMQDSEFMATLQEQFGYRLGRIIKAGKRQSYPLSLVKTDEQFSHRTVCIGNAAQTLHPIAGQGFNLAMRDAWHLAEHIVQRVGQGEDIGSYQSLSPLKSQRKNDQQNTILLTDSLVHLFSNGNPLLTAGRNLGLMLMNNHRILRDSFARTAMGQGARVKP